MCDMACELAPCKGKKIGERSVNPAAKRAGVGAWIRELKLDYTCTRLVRPKSNREPVLCTTMHCVYYVYIHRYGMLDRGISFAWTRITSFFSWCRLLQYPTKDEESLRYENRRRSSSEKKWQTARSLFGKIEHNRTIGFDWVWHQAKLNQKIGEEVNFELMFLTSKIGPGPCFSEPD